MIATAPSFKPYTVLANCCLLAGLFAILHACFKGGTTFFLPEQMPTLADYLLAAGLIPHLSFYMARWLVNVAKS